MPRAARGFTLIELMIVVAIIGILAAIAIPKFSELVRKSQEGSTKGNLGAIRSALSIYYGDLEGLFPARLDTMTQNGKYYNAIPYSKVTPYHEPWNVGTYNANLPGTNYGNWWYNNSGVDANFGTVRVNCIHTDTKGEVWTSY